MKLYLAHPIATTGEESDSIRVSKRLRDIGFEVYAPAENKSINDKTNNPSPEEIYDGDVPKILDCDIFVVNLTGGLQSGTDSEVGMVGMHNEKEKEFRKDKAKIIPIVAYTSNKRVQNPQFSDGVASASLNHFVLGIVKKWGKFTGSEDDMIDYLKLKMALARGAKTIMNIAKNIINVKE